MKPEQALQLKELLHRLTDDIHQIDDIINAPYTWTLDAYIECKQLLAEVYKKISALNKYLQSLHTDCKFVREFEQVKSFAEKVQFSLKEPRHT